MTIRRQILFAMSVCAVAPNLAFAQKKIWRIGFLAGRHLDFVESDYSYGPFTHGLRELGYVEGKAIAIEWRSAEGDYSRLSALAVQLVQANVDVIVTAGVAAAMAAQKASSTVPIVMLSVGDPVTIGLVKSLARPGGNSTGLTHMAVELGPKFMELLRTVVPNATRVSVLVNPGNRANVSALEEIQKAAARIGVKIQSVNAGSRQQIEAAFDAIARQRAEALILTLDPFFIQEKQLIAGLALKQRLPSLSANDEYVDAGGLMSYGPNIRDIYRRGATYVDKIIKGAKPGDLPVEQPTLFELTVNLKTAKALGVKMPNSVLVQATKVIE